MDLDELKEKIKLPNETAKLDFKIRIYKIYDPAPLEQEKKQDWKQSREKQWSEFAKDVIALANGNIGTSMDTGYLIIGVGDQLNNIGQRALKSVEESIPSKTEILNKINSYCRPRIPELNCECFSLCDKKIFVVSIPPSPYVHELSKQLITPKKEFSPHSILLRRADGEETYVASKEESNALRQEREVHAINMRAPSSQIVESDSRVPKLSLEVYDRKIEIYRSTQKLLSLVARDGNITIESLFNFSSETNEAIFLFNYQVGYYLTSLYKKAAKLYGVSSTLSSSSIPIGDRRNELAEEKREILDWFAKQFEESRKVFYNYIRL